MRLALFTFIIACMAPAALAQLPVALSPAPHETATVTDIIDGDTVILSSGVQVRLVGIQAPKLPLGRPHFEAWPLADEAKALLTKLTSQKQVALYYGGRKKDRHGRALAHLETADGTWLQAAMLQAGMARVYSFADNRSAIAELLAFERQARDARRGLWNHPAYQVYTAKAIARSSPPIGQFVLVEGTVHAVTHRYEQTYINFAEDWRSDFSIEIKARERRNFATQTSEGEAALSSLRGQRVRVRGWVYRRNGPMISLTHPEQIETLQKIEGIAQ